MARWPGKLEGIGASVKEMRLLVHPKRPVAAIAWPGDTSSQHSRRPPLLFTRSQYMKLITTIIKPFKIDDGRLTA